MQHGAMRHGAMQDGVSLAQPHRACGRGALLASLLAFLTACAAPIHVSHLDRQQAYRELDENVLSSGAASELTRTSLRARGLLAEFERDPAHALAELHASVRAGDARPADLFTLCEASFVHAQASGSRAHFLASAIYALAFLFPEDATAEPGRLDPRTRLATEIYAAALVETFRTADGERVELTSGRRRLPFGWIDVTVEPGELVQDGRPLIDLVPAAEIRIEGLRNRYRHAGLGAPLAARSVPAAAPTRDSLLGPHLRVSVTAVLTIERPVRALRERGLAGRIDVYASSRTREITLARRSVPLAYEDSVAIALTLEASRPWELEYAGFFGWGDSEAELPLLRGVEPHRAGRTPVVFVHGTASSPARWADMFNDLWSEPAVASRFEPWFFMYDTGNPIAYSSERLRALLDEAVARIDPAGQDVCLRSMVVVGHSQGGLLAKMTAIDTGDDLWNAVAKKPLDALDLSPETQKLLRAAMFVDPLPFVRRLVFIATPHRGSYQAAGRLADWMKTLIRLPKQLTSLASEIVKLQKDGVVIARNARGVGTSVDNMREGNPFLTALATIPISPSVARHSIIPVRGDGPLDQLADGVVTYQSAHIADADSELVVRAGHSAQAEPATIEEVRRILAVHARDLADAGLACGVRAPGTHEPPGTHGPPAQ
jgi:pimeloyl-ACP methyl ester carboxylesterase